MTLLAVAGLAAWLPAGLGPRAPIRWTHCAMSEARRLRFDAPTLTVVRVHRVPCLVRET